MIKGLTYKSSETSVPKLTKVIDENAGGIFKCDQQKYLDQFGKINQAFAELKELLTSDRQVLQDVADKAKVGCDSIR